MKNTKVLVSTAALAAVIMFQNLTLGQSQAGQRVYYLPPLGATVWCIPSWATNFTFACPLPFFPYDPVQTPLYVLDPGSNSFFYADPGDSANSTLTRLVAGPMDDSGTGDGYGPLFNTNDLWLEIQLDTNLTSYASLILHGTSNGLWQLFIKPDLNPPLALPAWTPGQIIQVTDNTNEIFFNELFIGDPPASFFRGVGGITAATILNQHNLPDPTEPCSPSGSGQPNYFHVSIGPTLNFPLTVLYAITGSAINGTDYTNIPASVTIPANSDSADIWIQPNYDPALDFDETVTLTLLATNGVLIDPANYSASMVIKECTSVLAGQFTVVATNIFQPASIDFHAPSNSLLIGVHFTDGLPYDFALIHTNNTLTQWSGVSGVIGEVKFATVKITANGFTNGDLFFDNHEAGGIAWLSADGTKSNLNWLTLTNQGDLVNSFYVDQTGLWGRDLLALGQYGGLWRINAQTNTTLVTTLPSFHLEGLLTLPNDPRYGPWAGKLMAEDENLHLIYAADTNGVVTTYDLGIEADQFTVIPTNQPLYLLNYADSDSTHSRVLKMSSDVFTNYLGDILVEQAGEANSFQYPAGLFIVHWDNATSTFITRGISLNDYYDGHLEHFVFAPINIPDL